MGHHMTRGERNQKIIDAIEAETIRASASKKTARDALIKDGIYTKKGKLRVEFGGGLAKKETVAA